VNRGILHTTVGVESHRSNRRVERGIIIIRDGLVKFPIGSLETGIEEIISPYNNAYHNGIKYASPGTWNDESENVNIENICTGRYTGIFKKRYRKVFEISS
jgi:hypothetical protein